jgi:hypothetical protein
LVVVAISGTQQPVGWGGVDGLGGISRTAGAAYFGLMAIPVGLACWGIWSGAALGRLTDGPRISALSLATLGVVFGLISLLYPGSVSDVYAVVGIVLVVGNAAIIYALTLDPAARGAFQAMANSEYGDAPEATYGAAPMPWPSPAGGHVAGYPVQPWYRPQPEYQPFPDSPPSPAFPVQPGFARRPGFAPPREASYPPPDPALAFTPPPRPRQ